MFQHILFPTDGSPASKVAAEACMRFAAAIGAKVTAIHVVPPLHVFPTEFDASETTHEAYRKNRDRHVAEILKPLEQRAIEANVICRALLVEADDPYDAIITAARDHQCDLILMASHGRRGIKGVLIGSQTQKVLTHSSIPVLVYR